MHRITVIDSHTGGEPTRIIIQGGPELEGQTLQEQLTLFRSKFDHIRSAVVNEPRGSDVLVGGLLCKPAGPDATAGIIFFNNAGFLGMCGHGTIGLMVTLKHLGKVSHGVHQIETPVGPIEAELRDQGEVAVKNVPSYRFLKDVSIDVPGIGNVVGDVAWGGNWFFLVKNSNEDLRVENADHLTRVALQIRESLEQSGIQGKDGPIDHVELFSDPLDPRNDSRNFVLCPGGAYDRSPCGTGTSAKLACLAADGKLQPGEVWRQESIIGSVFCGSYQDQPNSEAIIPTISGTAYICGQSELILDPDDPFCMGIR